MTVIISIDPGLKNMGFCVYNTISKQLFVEKINLLETKDGKKYKYSEGNLTYYIFNLIEDRKEWFDLADIITIEQQMNRKFLIIQHIFQAIFIQECPCVFVSPRSVRVYYNISMHNYKKNKEASVALVPSLVTPKQLKEINKYGTKKDDVAEAVILAKYTEAKYDEIIKQYYKPKSVNAIRLFEANEKTERKKKRLAKK